MTQLPDMLPVLPEILLAAAGMGLLLLGAYKGATARTVAYLAAAVMVALVFVVSAGVGNTLVTFEGLFVVDRFAAFAKVLILLASALVLILSQDYLHREGMAKPEYAVLVVFSTLGMLCLVSANDFMALYMALELMSLSLYVVAAMRRDTLKSSEAGLKYFVLGALGSGMYLYGASLVYGFTGSTNFSGVAALLQGGAAPSIGLIIGLVFVLAALAFKISAVPFHMWTPDVYEGAPTPVTAFFATAPKIAAICLLARVLIGPFGDLVHQWQQVVMFISIASMAFGSLAAMVQKNIKRMLAYSSIGHVGFLLVGLAAGTEEGVRGVLTYLAIYLFMNLGTFACVLSMRVNGRMVEDIKDLSGLWKNRPGMALALLFFMFSMAGVPPFAGFIGKLYVFMAAVNAGLYPLAILGVLSSVIAAFYYIRIVKIMYFDAPADAFDRPVSPSVSAIMLGGAVFVLVAMVFLDPLTNAAQAAAASLFHG
jgi:NADH-quinone oxidoreductase subunit N